jgi:putative tryptophan/tyrosine transport system substrate-binding protein
MHRRTFIGSLAGGLVATAHFANAQQPAIPAIGFLRSTPAAPFEHLVVAFREGLKEIGFVEGQNVAIEQRWADNQLDRLPGLAADLVARKVAVIVCNGGSVSAAKAATATIPIVFVIGEDPVARGLVTSLNRPGGNLTGVNFFANQLGGKRLGLLLELVPKAAVIAFLMDPGSSASVAEFPEVKAAARTVGRKIVLVKAASEREFEPAFAAIVQAGAGALVVGGSGLFTSQSRQLVALAARHAIPAIYDLRAHATGGGLISYGANQAEAYRQAGVYAGRILKGAKPSEMPVLQASTFELVINMKTAKALGLTIPQSVLLRADEVMK